MFNFLKRFFSKPIPVEFKPKVNFVKVSNHLLFHVDSDSLSLINHNHYQQIWEVDTGKEIYSSRLLSLGPMFYIALLPLIKKGSFEILVKLEGLINRHGVFYRTDVEVEEKSVISVRVLFKHALTNKVVESDWKSVILGEIN